MYLVFGQSLLESLQSSPYKYTDMIVELLGLKKNSNHKCLTLSKKIKNNNRFPFSETFVW